MSASSVDRADVLDRVCHALRAKDQGTARSIARVEYPFEPLSNSGRGATELQSMRVFRADGFVCRYSGARLVFPGTLRLLSRLLPEEFPYHPNWKMTETHIAFWQLFPTIDHVVPVARGGVDDDTNWVTTSMLRNSAKANWTLDELGWPLRPRDATASWDGLTGWFAEFLRDHPEHRDDDYVARWHRAAAATAPEAPRGP